MRKGETKMTTWTKSMRRGIVATALMGMGMAACGSSPKPTALSVTESEPAPGAVSVDAPAAVKAGLVTLSLHNTGSAPHGLLLVRVEGDHSAKELVDAVSTQDAPPPDWTRIAGGVNDTPPGTTLSATMNVAPGSYFVVDPDTDDSNNSYARQGAIRPIQVTGKASSAAVPSADLTITAREYSFGLPKTVTAGTHTVKFKNTGAQPHMLVAVPMLPGKTLDDVKAGLAQQGPDAGPPPVDFEHATGAQVIDGGLSLVTTMTFQKGDYALLCFMNNRGGGPPHVELGMVQKLTVS